MKVFLGGTCAESKWREYIMPKLKCNYFNPVVDDWTPECQKIEEDEKEKRCDYHLYVITPKMQGVFSIAEAVNDSIKLPKGQCVFCITKEDDDRDFTIGEMKSLNATWNLIEKNGGKICRSLDEVVDYLNECSKDIIKEQRDLYEKQRDHISNLWNRLMKEIIPKDWYSLANDWWSVTEEEYEECVRRLNRPLIQKIIKKGKF